MTERHVAHNGTAMTPVDAFLVRMAALPEASDDCWEWPYKRNERGYGRVRLGTPHESYVHRVAFATMNGPIPDGLLVCHSCDNPPCCNPKHLWVGTDADNIRDAAAKGRLGAYTTKRCRGERCHTAKLTKAQVVQIRTRYRAGRGSPTNSTALGRKYGVSRTHICEVIRGESWKHVA